MNQEPENSLQVLNLMLASEVYGINIQLVQEIRVLSGLRKLPEAPDFWIGVIDFRDHMVPVIDLRILLQSEDISITDKTVVVIVSTEVAGKEVMVGLVVDSVSDVTTVARDKIRPAPSLQQTQQDLVDGIYKHGDTLVVLLNIGRMLAKSDMREVREQLKQEFDSDP